jgi:RNA polymerase sigma factor (sigma-70 family)
VTPAEVRALTPLVKACARRFTPASLPASIDRDDLESVAWQALIEAEATFDPKRGPFDAWAWLKMRGAVKDEVRRQRFGKRAGERGDVGEPLSADSAGQYETPDGSASVWDHHGLVDRRSSSVSDAAEARAMLSDKRLSARERFVIAGKAIGRRDTEIAADLGVTVRRVQQIKTDAHFLIRGDEPTSSQVAA